MNVSGVSEKKAKKIDGNADSTHPITEAQVVPSHQHRPGGQLLAQPPPRHLAAPGWTARTPTRKAPPSGMLHASACRIRLRQRHRNGLLGFPI